MGAIKQMQLRRGEEIRVELEELLELVEKQVAAQGFVNKEEFRQISDLCLAYTKLYPTDEMEDFGRMLIETLTTGRKMYEFGQDAAVITISAGS